jgi:hypothetical protein
MSRSTTICSGTRMPRPAIIIRRGEAHAQIDCGAAEHYTRAENAPRARPRDEKALKDELLKNPNQRIGEAPERAIVLRSAEARTRSKHTHPSAIAPRPERLRQRSDDHAILHYLKSHVGDRSQG